jgi:formamidopyrimidine-DNA glycosylase
MPELPEVEVVRRGLHPFSDGWRVSRVGVVEPRSLKRHPGPTEDFVHRLTGRLLTSVVRRGKFLWWETDNPELALVAHLGMSGQILIGDHPDDFGKLCRISLTLTHPTEPVTVLGFVDQRIFGYMALDHLVATADGQPAGRGAAPGPILFARFRDPVQLQDLRARPPLAWCAPVSQGEAEFGMQLLTCVKAAA